MIPLQLNSGVRQQQRLPFVKRFMSLRFLLSLVSLALLAVPVNARAQSTPVSPFTTQLVARLDRLAADSAVHARTGAANGMALFAAVPPDAIGRISDADLVRLLRLVEQGLGSVDAATCALAYDSAVPTGSRRRLLPSPRSWTRRTPFPGLTRSFRSSRPGSRSDRSALGSRTRMLGRLLLGRLLHLVSRTACVCNAVRPGRAHLKMSATSFAPPSLRCSRYLTIERLRCFAL